MNFTEKESNLCLDEEGRWYKEEKVRTLIDPVSLFKSSMDISFITPMLTPDSCIFMSPKLGGMLIYRFREMNFRAEMVVDIDNPSAKSTLFRPAFGPEEVGAGFVEPDPYIITYPKTMCMLLGIVFSGVSMGHSCLVAQDERTGILWHPPLPNIYGDGSVCLGDSFKIKDFTPTKDGLQILLDKFLEKWDKADWNTDLIMDAGAGWREFLVFDEKTKKQALQSRKDWTKYCPRKVSPKFEIFDIGFHKFYELQTGNPVEGEESTEKKEG